MFLFCLGSAVAIAITLLLCGSEGISAESSKRFTKVQFEHLIVGKSKEEVIKILGKPDDVPHASPKKEAWLYKRFLIDDSFTGTTFNRALIFFENNKYEDHRLSRID